MQQDTGGVRQDTTLCFTDDVISVIVSIMKVATEKEVRTALTEVNFFKSPSAASEVVMKCEVNTESHNLHQNVHINTKNFISNETTTNSSASQLVICEFVDRNAAVVVVDDNNKNKNGNNNNNNKNNESKHYVVVTNNLMDIFQSYSKPYISSSTFSLHSGGCGTTGMMSLMSSPSSSSPPPLPPSSSSSSLLVLSPTMEMVTCILISLRGGSQSNLNISLEPKTPLSLHHVCICTVDTKQPLESLLSLLQSVYDPILRCKREVVLRSQIQDLVSSIRSYCQTLPEVDLKRFIHTDILELCINYPAADVQQLMDYMGPARCTDTNFLRHVLFARNACRSVLETKFEGVEIVSVRDEVAYWQAILRWLEQVERQLHSREWKLVHRLLAHRVETSYELEFKMNAQLVRDYLSYLKNVPFHKIDDVEMGNYSALVEELFDAIVRPTRYPPLQCVRLVDSLLREMAERFVELVGNNNVLFIGTPEAQLQCLREITHVMQDLHERYLRTAEMFHAESPHIQKVTTEVVKVTPPTATTPRKLKTKVKGTLAAPLRQQPKQKYHYLLLLRARELWGFVNEHFYYERALQRIFGRNTFETGASFFFLTELKAAYEEFTTAIATSRCLWNVSASGAAEFQTALTTYKRRLVMIDERLALFVGTMLASAQEKCNNVNFAYTFAEGVAVATQPLRPPSSSSSSSPQQEKKQQQRRRSSSLSAAQSLKHGVSRGFGSGLSLYRIYSLFRPLQREKVQAVVTGFQMALLEQMRHEIKDVKERYFDAESSRDAVQLSVARFGVTAVVGRMMWEQSIQKEIEDYLVRHDAIHEHGWHQLLYLRTIEHRWCLDNSLAHFFGVTLDDLVTKELLAWSEVHGTAYALAYLTVAHAKDMSEWSTDPYIHIAQQFVHENDASAINYAKSRLLILRVGHGRRSEGREIRDARNFCDTIAQHIQERVVEWCEDVRRRIALLDVCPTTMKLKGPLWKIVELSVEGSSNNNTNSNSNGGGGGGGRGSGTRHINKNIGNATFDAELTRIVMPNVPSDIWGLLQDMYMLDSMRLLENHTQLVGDVRSFFRHNEGNFRIANCLAELVNAFLLALSGEDELMAHLATEEYASVYHFLHDGAKLRWSDEERVTQFTQEFSGRVYAFCDAASRVREITADIESDIAKLRSCYRTYKSQVVVARVVKMCTLVDHLYSQSANAGWWVRRVQARLDAAILRQLEEHLRRWTKEFFSMARDTRFINKNTETAEFHLKPLRVRMLVVFKKISLSIPAAACRNHWIGVLNRCFAWVHTMPTLLQLKKEELGEKLSPKTQQHLYQHQPLPMSTQTYDRLLERLDPKILMEPLLAIEKTVQDAVMIETQWRRGQQLLNIELSVLQQRLGNDMEKWCSVLQKIRDMATGLMDFTQPCTLVGGIVIDADEAQNELGRKLDGMTQHIHLRYRDVVEKLLEECYHRIMEERNVVESRDVIGDLNDAAEFLCDLPDIKAKMQEMARQIMSLGPAEEYLTRQGFSLPDSWIYVRRVKMDYTVYCDLVDRKVTALELRRPLLRDNIKKQEETFRSQVDELEKAFEAIANEAQKQEQEKEGEEEAYSEEISGFLQQRFSNVQEQATRLSEEKRRIIKLRSALSMSAMVEGKLDVIIARMDELQWVCGHVANAYKQLGVLGQTPFFEMVPQHLHEGLLAIEREVRAFPEDIRDHQAYINLLRCVEKRLSFRRLMQELRSDVMTPLERAEQHWMTLKIQLRAPWRLGELTVGDIWHSDPEKNAKIYTGVLEFAQGELRLESQLNQIIAFWNSFEFNTMVYRDKLLLIRSWSTVFEKISDDLDSFQGMRSSPFFFSQHVVTMVAEWENRLNLLRQILEVFMAVQRRWVHLDSIFTDNVDIRRQLPDDAAQFELLSHEFMNIVPKSVSFGATPVLRAQFFMQDKKLLAAIERLEGQLSWVQRSLSTYLDLQRRRFPRMFFVGDDDLLEIIGNSNNPGVIEKHLPKMFTALARFIIDNNVADNMSVSSSSSSLVNILGFSSAEGEEVVMAHPVVIKGRTLHEWLTDVESLMVVSLRQLVVSAVESLVSLEKVTPEWIRTFPLQVICLAFQVWWVRLQEETFAVWQEEVKNNKKLQASMAVTQMVELLDQLALDVTLPNLTRPFRYAIEELINITVYQRDVSRHIETRRVVSAEEFEWLRVLRLYLSSDGSELLCRMADASFRHGFEYLGWYKRLVQTVLTDRCYLTMTQALHTRLGGSPVGPAGSGKTETVKALGAQLGRHVLVFNCDNTFDFDAVGRIFIGLCQVGAWGCFDEFNRLEERVLSAVSEQIQTIQEALSAQATTVTLDQQIVPLRESVALFVTMNPGFAGRSNLPSNVKQLFRSITMAAPDRETIAEVMLFAQGFRTAETLSRKIVPLFNLCAEKFSKQAHYDFGLRALKSVLVTAGDLRRASKSDIKSESGTNNVAFLPDAVYHEDIECEIILRSLIISITPRLVTEDVSLFYPLLQDFFPGCQLPETAIGTLRAAVEEVCRATNYVPTPAWVEKVFQLYHTRKMRHGLMLVGPSGTGKTSCWKTLLRAMARIPPLDEDEDGYKSCFSGSGSAVVGSGGGGSGGGGGGGGGGGKQRNFSDSLETHAYVIDPKAMSKAKLFGVFDGTTREWKDGVFTGILRTIINNEKSHERTYKQHWIVFDGDVDPLWVENINSLLDDNKVYTLPNGERLGLPPSVRILFEVQDLRYATPATVSRCGMVWFSHGTVPITSLLNRNLSVFYRVPLIDNNGTRRVIFMTEGGGGEGVKSRACGNHFIATRGVSECCCETLIETGNKSLAEETMTGDKASFIDGLPLSPISSDPLEKIAEQIQRDSAAPDGNARLNVDRCVLQLQAAMANVWAAAFVKGGLMERAFELIHSNKYWKKGIMEHNDLQMLHSTQLFLVDGIWQMWKLHTQNVISFFSTDILRKYAANVLHYAILWGLGASLDHDHRKQLAMDLIFALKSSFPFLSADEMPDSANLLDLEPDPENGGWRDVRERVNEKNIVMRADQIGLNNMIIQTVDTRRHEKILKVWINGGNAAILCGPPGSGKTMLVTSVLRSCTEYDVVFLNFSSGTGPINIIRALEQYCSVQNNSYGLVMSPSSGKKLLFFCDEINLPAKDHYGTQAVIQFLRQLIELGGYYRGSDNAWVKVENVQVIGACNPPTDVGRVSISQRFLRLAPVLFVNFPTDESLCVIYTSYCRSILSFNLHIQQMYAEKLARVMVDMYTATQARFTQWQKPHYVYSPRDLSRWTRAIYNGIVTWDDLQRSALTVEGLVSLSLHEGLRVFQDRLVEKEEREWTATTINRCFFSQFGDVITDVLFSLQQSSNLLYSNILGRSYSESSRDELRAHIEHKLEIFCSEEVNVKLVVYDGMVDHVTRINRVLQQPMGHMLLAGLSGVGKTIISRFVAWMNNMTVFRLGVHRNYKLDDYERDLRIVLRRVGCKLEQICFIFDDSNLLDVSFLEYMNALLASGEVPGLFDGDEWVKLMAELRDSVAEQQVLNMSNKPQKLAQENYENGQSFSRSPRLSNVEGNKNFDNDNNAGDSDFNGGGNGGGGCSRAGITRQKRLDTVVSSMYVDTTSEQELYRWFIGNVKRNLHVIFTTNPSSRDFANRAVGSPALFNRCTIDWFGDWDHYTRYQIARQLTQKVDVMFSFENNPQQKDEGEVRKILAESFCRIYEITSEVNSVLRLQNVHQGTFITPRHFTNSLRHMLMIYEEKKGKSREQLAHLQSGIAKLDAAFEDVKKKRAELCEHEAALADSSIKAQNMLDCIVTNTEKTKLEKQDSERLRQQLKEEEDKILADKNIVHRQLLEVEPALREAEAGLNSIKPEYLREIRAYTTPPRMVKRVLEAVLILMGEADVDEWDIVKLHIRRDDFLACVKAFKPSSITEEAILIVKKMLQEEGFTYDAAMRASKMTGPLLQWVKAQTNYGAILASVRPLRARIEQLSVEHNAKREHLESIEAEIAKMQSMLATLKEEYQNITENSARIKNEMSGVAARCKRAETLLRQLFDERERWETEMKGSHIETRTTIGNCVIAAASLAYFGYFDEHTRHSVLFARWRQCLRQLQIPFCEKLCSVVEYLVTPQERLAWERHGLPKDYLCVENAMILSRCQQYPLVIDPNGVAAAFLLQKHAAEKINTASFSKPGYLKQLDMAVRFGYPILVQDAEFFDPALGSLVNHEVHSVRGHALVRLGAQDVEVATTFRLFLLTRDSHYQPSPGMAGQVCIVNFTVTQSSLQSQCRNRIMLHEHSELDARRSHILRMQGECRLRLRLLEQDLLTSIASSEGSLLDNDALTVALEDLKNRTKMLKDDIAESDVSMNEIMAVEAQYEPLAAALAKLYFAIRRFSQLHRLYHYSVAFIFRLLADALEALPPRSAATLSSGSDEQRAEDALRLQQLTCHLFSLAHHRLRRGMFSQDHLVLAIVLGKLRSSISDDVGRQITLEEWSWFEDALLQSHTTNTVNDSTNNSDAVVGYSASNEIPDILRECGVCSPSCEPALVALLHRPLFKAVLASLLNPQDAAAWRAYFASVAPYLEVLPAFSMEKSIENGDDKRNKSATDTVEHTRSAYIASLLLFYTRRDVFLRAVYEFLRRFFDSERTNGIDDQNNNNRSVSFFSSAGPPDLMAVQKELSENTPLILVSNSCSDPTPLCEALARSLDVRLHVAVMGSATGLNLAEHYLTNAMEEGTWVLLKNIHLARAYADSVEKRLHRERSEGRLNPNFRLIIYIESTADSSSSSSSSTATSTGIINCTTYSDGSRDCSEESLAELSPSFVETSVMLVFEPPPGIKSSLLQTVGTLTPFSGHGKQPADMQRIYLAAAWLHAVVMERLLYIPMGWSRQYEFNDMEFWRILKAIDSWVKTSKHSSGRDGGQVIDRGRIPWTALQTIVGTTLYGGKISNEFDQLLVDFFCSQFLSDSVFSDDYLFVSKTTGTEPDACLKFPSIQSLHDVQAWVCALPNAGTPLWAGLPASVSRVICAQHATTTLERLATLRFVGEKDQGSQSTKNDGSDKINIQEDLPQSIGETQWGRRILSFSSRWCTLLQALAGATVTNVANEKKGVLLMGSQNTEPTVMAIQREYLFALECLGEILDELRALKDVCTGTRSPTATQFALVDHFLKDQVPQRWACYYQSYPMTADEWLVDFKNRVEHIKSLYEGVGRNCLENTCISLGLLFWPGAFLTATKQQAARRQGLSLEHLKLQLNLMPEDCVLANAANKKSEDNRLVWNVVSLSLYSARVQGDCGVCELLHASSNTSSTRVGALIFWEPIKIEASANHTTCMVSKSSLLMRLTSQSLTGKSIATPLYLNSRRDVMLEVVDVDVDPVKAPMRVWYERGACLFAWSRAE